MEFDILMLAMLNVRVSVLCIASKFTMADTDYKHGPAKRVNLAID